MNAIFKTLGVIVLLVIAGCVYFHSRRPRFSGTSVSAIEVHIAPDYYANPTNGYWTRITDRPACDAILREFRQARPIFGGTKVEGELTFLYDNGKTDVVRILPGLSHGQYSFIHGGSFWMPSERFYGVMKAAGVDISRIPKD